MAQAIYLPLLTIMCIVTLTFDQGHGTSLIPVQQFCENYSNPCFQWKLMARTMFKPLWA
jgi:hypothetical protein